MMELDPQEMRKRFLLEKLKQPQLGTLRFLAIALCLLGLSPISAVAQDPVQFCQPSDQKEEKEWEFSIVEKAAMPTWSGAMSGENLVRSQAGYFSQKSSPFARKGLFPTMSFYEPNITLKIAPRLAYSKTVAGYTCATVIGATLVAESRPVIYLAGELAERSCVATKALEHQLKHDKVTKDALKELAAKSEKFKGPIYEIYKVRGSAGRSQNEINNGLKELEAAAVGTMSARFSSFLRGNRVAIVENSQNLSVLANSCDGLFRQYAESLAK